MPRRRYEMLLPLRFNDGRPIPDELFNQTREDLLARFEGLSWVPQPIQGLWVHEGTRYEDVTVRDVVYVDPNRLHPAEIMACEFGISPAFLRFYVSPWW